MSATVEPTNGFQVCGWMVTDLHLEGMELMVYALVHTFSQGKAGKYLGSTSYICDWFGITKPTALKYLQGLCEKGLIERTEKVVNGVTFAEYEVSKEFLPPVKNFNGGVKNFYPDNNRDNPPVVSISNKLDISTTTPQGVSAPKSTQIVQLFLNDGCAADDLRDWITARKGAKVTEAVYKGMKREAGKAGITLAEAVRICAENSWRGFRAEYLERRKATATGSQQQGGTFMSDIQRTYDKLAAGWAARAAQMEGGQR